MTSAACVIDHAGAVIDHDFQVLAIDSFRRRQFHNLRRSHGAYEDAENQCNFISPYYFLFLSLFSVAPLPVCCINYREQLFSQYDKQRKSAIHVSGSQKSDTMLYCQENREEAW
jgi:hypothetical protein